MGTLNCLKCAQTVEAPTFAEADVLINHAACSRKCSGDESYMRWNGEPLTGQVLSPPVENIVVPRKSKKSK